jgi:signal transduction histidine kinase/CheY-like chemotaxis protein
MKAKRRNGALYIGETVISSLRPLSGSGVNLLFSCRDVTREVELEEQVRLSQKMEAVGLLAGGVAHDFNNVLQAIGGYADLCRESELDPQERDEMLGEILRATERAGQLTKQLLAFARKKAPVRGHVELGVTVGNLLGMTSRLIGPNIRVLWTPPPEPLSVLVDASQIEQVLMNLCVNARDAMPEGGTLRVSVLRASPTQYAGDMRDNCAVLEVSDSGIGIESAHLARLFEPFFSTKQNGNGTGLGLSVVYGIVQAHEGWIDVKSSPGEGTCFRIYLPLSTTVTANPPSPDVPAHPQANKRTLLVVYDDPHLVEIAVRIFERAGFQVLTASNGVEAESTFRAHQGQVDGVLLDLIMPKRGGLETWQIIDELCPGQPVVFCSGYMQDAQDKIPRRDTIGIVSKPYSVHRLVEEMNRVITNSGRVRQV